MDHLPPSTTDILNCELARLYERRLVVDELIRSLERYAASDSRQPVELLARTLPRPPLELRREL